MESTASAEARKQSLHQEIETLTARQSALTQKREQLAHQRTALAAEVAARPDLAFASALVDASEIELARRQQRAQEAEKSYREAEQIQSHARNAAQDAQARVTRLHAEAEAITALLQHHEIKQSK